MNVSLYRLSRKIPTMGITVEATRSPAIVFPHSLSAADDATNGHQSQFTDTELGLAWKYIYRKLPSNENLHSETIFTGLVLIRGSETSLDCIHPLFSYLVYCMCVCACFLAHTQESSLLLSIWEFGLKSKKCVPWNCLKLPTDGVEIEGALLTDSFSPPL